MAASNRSRRYERRFQGASGRGPYGITVTPKGDVWYASRAGNHIARIDLATSNATVVDPPTPSQGARRVWVGFLRPYLVSEWKQRHVSVHDPAQKNSWKAWKLPGDSPRAYAVYVDDKDKVWVTDFSANAIVRSIRSWENSTYRKR